MQDIVRALSILLLFSLILMPPSAHAGVQQTCSGAALSGTCNFVSSTDIITSYDSSAGGGSIQKTVSPTTSPLPLIQQVRDQNAQNGQWLITCPSQPDASNTLEYFTTDDQSFILGNRCLTDKGSLSTTATWEIDVAWGTTTPARASAEGIGLLNPAAGAADVLAYSGATETNMLGNYNISSGYDSSSYIFGQIPPEWQHGLWTWHAKYVDLAGIATGALDQDDDPGTLALAFEHTACGSGTDCTTTTTGGGGGGGGGGGSGCTTDACCAANYNTCYAGCPSDPNNSYYDICHAGCSDALGACEEGVNGGAGTAAALPAAPQASQFQSNAIGNSTGTGNSVAFGRLTQSHPGTLQFDACDDCLAACSSAYPFPPDSNLDALTACDDACVWSPACSGGGSTTTISGGSTTTISGGTGLCPYESYNYGPGNCDTFTQNYDCSTVTTECPYYVWTCQYDYNYDVQGKVDALGNAQIPILEQTATLPTGDYLQLRGQIYSPFTAYSGSEVHGPCALALAIFKLVGLACGSGWKHIASDGTLVLTGGETKNNLNVYTKEGEPDRYWTAYGLGGLDYAAGYVDYSGGGQQYESVGALPYLVYNMTMPASSGSLNSKGEYLNLSFDLYSPHNYLNPSEYLDQFPLFTDSGMFLNYKDKLGELLSSVMSLDYPDQVDLSIPNIITYFLTSFTAPEAADLNLGGILKTLGKYVDGQITYPIYLAASPNDYLYVLATDKYSTDGTREYWHLDANSKVYLYEMRFIPEGYFNLSNDQPNTVVTASGTEQMAQMVWNAFWEGTPAASGKPATNGYWANAVLEQSNSLYMVNAYKISDPASPFWQNGWTFTTVGSAGTTSSTTEKFVPAAVMTDYNNDLFLLGADINNNGCKGFGLAELEAGGEKYRSDCIGVQSGFNPPTELAVSPGGQDIYLANSSTTRIGYGSGTVFVYSTPSGGSGGFDTAGTISLSYSNPSFNPAYNFNISAYLANGGPFGNALIAQTYSGAVGTNDIAGNHWPVAIYDYQGYIYVIDDWKFMINAMPSAILTLRVFQSDGTEVPIDSSLVNTYAAISGSPMSASPGSGTIPTGGWPPYGWVLSANISTTTSYIETYVSYCVAGCSETPNTLVGAPYPPIGPWINNYGNVHGAMYSRAILSGDTTFGFSTDFNGTSYMIAHSSNQWDGELYSELLAFRLNLINYTSISYGAGSPYVCYIDRPYSNTPCIYDSSGAVANTLAPLLGVPSSFSFVESQGSANNYFSPSELASSFTQAGASAESGSGGGKKTTGSPSCSSDGTLSCSNSGTPYCTTSGAEAICSQGSPECVNGDGSVASGSVKCSSQAVTQSGQNGGMICSNGAAPRCDSGNGNPVCSTAVCASSGGISGAPSCGSSGDSMICPVITCPDGSTPSCSVEGDNPVCTISNGQSLPTCPTDGSTPTCTSSSGTQVPATCPQPACAPGGSALACASGNPECSSQPQAVCSSGGTVLCDKDSNGNKIDIKKYPGTAECTSSSSIPIPTTPGGTGTLPSTYINSVIEGYVMVPYYYQYEYTETWSPNPAPVSSVSGSYPTYIYPNDAAACPAYSFGIDPFTTTSTYRIAFAQNDIKSTHLNDTVQGGDTYMAYAGGSSAASPSIDYYVANLSDAGVFIPPVDINYNVYSNRWFGELFINQTITPAWALDSAENQNPWFLTPMIVNAVNTAYYQSETFNQVSTFGSNPGYAAQNMQQYGAPIFGADCGSGCPYPYYYSTGSVFPGTSALIYAQSMQPSLLPLMQLLEKASYTYSLVLDLSQNNDVLGYNRLVYTFADSFNNIITAPLAVDISNPTRITASVQADMLPENSNETNVIITGTAAYSVPTGTVPLPEGSSIYLYYNNNINYYDRFNGPSDSPPVNYYANALLCAFAPQSSSCELANPLSTLTQPEGTIIFEGEEIHLQTSGPYEAGKITFSTQYDYNQDAYQTGGLLAGQSQWQCAPTPKSLLDLPENNCNIYDSGESGAFRANPYNPSVNQYCKTNSPNGDGIFTSQLGLVGIATTNSIGGFSFNFDACGSGTESLILQYYGYPGPEPIPVNQPSLQYSAYASDPAMTAAGGGSYATANEFNYAYAPTTTFLSMTIGNYTLSFGGISIIGLVAFLSALLAVFLRRIRG